MEIPREELEKQLMDDLLTLYRLIVDEVYNPTQFYTRLMRDKAVECSRYLLGSKTLSYGFDRLFDAGRLELTVENFILKSPVYHVFYSEAILNTAKQKMKDWHFDINGDRLETFAKTHPQYKFHHLGKG